MKRLFVYQIRNRWFGQLTVTTRSEHGDVKEIRNIVIPQSVSAIERLAGENGYTIEWDAQVPPESRAS
jgi:hypothetical protein